jgi:ATPase subunit of ABC transporter with duplicated ATPase domains
MGEAQANSGVYKWGVTIRKSYLPNDNSAFFNQNSNLIDWLRQYSSNQEEAHVRGFLGRMLFTGEETLKSCRVLSGGEKMRCMISKIMLEEPNFIILDEPTNHLDLESITSLNRALMEYTGTVLFISQDHTFTQSVANRIIEIGPKGMIDKLMEYDDYLSNEDIKAQRAALYGVGASIK